MSWRATFMNGGRGGTGRQPLRRTETRPTTCTTLKMGCKYVDGTGDAPAGNDYPYNVAGNVIAKGFTILESAQPARRMRTAATATTSTIKSEAVGHH